MIQITDQNDEDEEWMEGYLINDPEKRIGFFPTSYVKML